MGDAVNIAFVGVNSVFPLFMELVSYGHHWPVSGPLPIFVRSKVVSNSPADDDRPRKVAGTIQELGKLFG